MWSFLYIVRSNTARQIIMENIPVIDKDIPTELVIVDPPSGVMVEEETVSHIPIASPPKAIHYL